MKVLFVESDREDELNCSIWRCRRPAAAINRLAPEHEAAIVHVSEWVKGAMEQETLDADIVVFQRSVEPTSLRIITHFQANGVKFVLDLDDAYDKIDPSNKGHTYWKRGVMVEPVENWVTTPGGVLVKRMGKRVTELNFDPVEYLQASIRLFDAISSPSELILRDLAPYCPKRSLFLPNLFETERYKPVETPHTGIGNGLNVGWGGSYGHDQSFLDSGAFTALARMEKRGLLFTVVGNRSIDALAKFPHMFLPAVEFDKWPEMVSHFNIGLAPLSGLYDQRRSPIKVVDYGLLGIPWIASESLPYNGLDGRGGMLVRNTTKGWETALLNIVDSYDEYRKLALDQRSWWVQHFDIDQNIHIWLEGLKEVIDG
jgi:hypothetical protein